MNGKSRGSASVHINMGGIFWKNLPITFLPPKKFFQILKYSRKIVFSLSHLPSSTPYPFKKNAYLIFAGLFFLPHFQ